jgi:hypothetical protein
MLLLIHILGDYYFQGSRLAEGKTARFGALIIHSFIYLAVALIFCIFVGIPSLPMQWIMAGLMLALSHFIIDSVKFAFFRKSKRMREIYIIDQLLHIFALIVIGMVFGEDIHTSGDTILYQEIFGTPLLKLLSWVLAMLIIWKPVNITIKNLTSPYRPKETELSLGSSGAFIGGLERSLILLFLSLEQYSAIGLVLTAKSIARYSKIQEDKTFAEYYLLGTLLSVLSVILTYFAVF